MSIVDSLLYLFRPSEYRERQEERRRKLVAPRQTPDRDAPKQACSICGWQGEGRFCLRCLAPTMRKVPKER